jgi:hypothetical protein
MSKKVLRVLIVSATLMLGVASYGQAVDSGSVSIPFTFVVRGASFPAGNYNLVGTSNPRIAVLRNVGNPKVSCLVVLREGKTLSDGNAAFVVERSFHGEQK